MKDWRVWAALLVVTWYAGAALLPMSHDARGLYLIAPLWAPLVIVGALTVLAWIATKLRI